MVSLTAPGALSSSGMEPRGVKKGMSGRFLGRRKKKAVKGNSLGGESAGTSNNNIESLGSNLQLQMQPQHLPESALPQSRNIPKALKKRLPSMNNVAVPVNAVTKESYPPPPPTRPQQQQQTKRKKKEQLRRQQPQQTNVLEMETRDDEKSIRSVSNIQCQPTSPPLDASTRSSNSNAPTANSTGIVPNIQDVAAAATAAVSNPPSTSLARKLQVGGSNASADGSVLIARSGWSVTSNASSAMNSEHYIQSLDNLPAVSSPKIRSEIVSLIFCLRVLHSSFSLLLIWQFGHAICPSRCRNSLCLVLSITMAHGNFPMIKHEQHFHANLDATIRPKLSSRNGSSRFLRRSGTATKADTNIKSTSPPTPLPRTTTGPPSPGPSRPGQRRPSPTPTFPSHRRQPAARCRTSSGWSRRSALSSTAPWSSPCSRSRSTLGL